MTTSTKRPGELKPCPFCGGPADFIGEPHGYSVRCLHCLATSGPGDYGYQVTTKWNTRAPTNESPAPQAAFGCKRAGGFVDHNCMAPCDCDKTMRFATAPLASPSLTAGAGIPKGWVLVPLEPTDEMCAEAFGCDPSQAVTRCWLQVAFETASNDDVAKLWRAMISAAPATLTEQPSEAPPSAPDVREALDDPNVVHLNMLRGGIARPTREQIKHLYPELFSNNPAIITDFDRFYGDPVERFKAMADANHEGPIDVAHFKMWCRIAEREIRHARALASPSLTAGASSELRRVWLDRLNAIAPAVENLAGHQEQCDFDGVMVKVSRQALDEVLNVVNDLAVSFVTAPTTLTEQPSEAPPSAPDVREALEWVRDEIFTLCEATEDSARDGQDFSRGRCFEAKGIRRAMGEVIRERLAAAQPAKGER